MTLTLTDFSPINDDKLQAIGATTITNSNRAVKRNLGIYKSKNGGLRTGRYCGITWMRDSSGAYILNNGNKQSLIISPRFDLSIDFMIQKISEDDEFFEYLCDDQPEGDRMFTFFFDEEMMEVREEDNVCDNRLMVAMSFIHLLYMETRRSLMKKIIRNESNFTGKVKGKILFNKQIPKNLVRAHEERIYCGYVEKSEDIFENQVLKHALLQAKEYLYAKKISNNQVLREIKACEVRFLKVSEVGEMDPEEIENVQLPAMYSNYNQVMKLAYLVIAQISMTSNLQNDANKIVPYAVNMPLLFECFCRTLLKESLKTYYPNWRMLKFVPDKSRDYDETEYGIRTIPGRYYISGKIVPDIVLVNEKKEYIVLDVKYKEFIWENLKLSKTPTRREDRLQLLAYNEIYQPKLCGHLCPVLQNKNVRIMQLPTFWFKKDITNLQVPYYMFSIKNDKSSYLISFEGCIKND